MARLVYLAIASCSPNFTAARDNLKCRSGILSCSALAYRAVRHVLRIPRFCSCTAYLVELRITLPLSIVGNLTAIQLSQDMTIFEAAACLVVWIGNGGKMIPSTLPHCHKSGLVYPTWGEWHTGTLSTHAHMLFDALRTDSSLHTISYQRFNGLP